MEITNDFILYMSHHDAPPVKYAYYATDRGATPIVQFINNQYNYKSPARGLCLRT